MERRTETVGLLLAAVCSFFFSVETLVAKMADLPPVVVTWYGYFGMALLSAPVMLSQKSWNLSPRAVRLIALRSIIGTVCHVTAFSAIELIPLGDASVLFYTSPAFTILMASIFLREPCSLFSACIILVVMAGIILVTQPPLQFLTSSVTSEYATGVVMALLSSLTDAAGNVMLRELKSLHYSILMFLHGVLSLTFTSLLIPFTRSPKLVSPVYPILMSFFSAIEQFSLVWALKLARAGPVSTCQVMDIIFAYVYQVLFFNETVTLVSFLGAAIIIGAVAVMSQREEKSKEKMKLDVPDQHVC